MDQHKPEPALRQDFAFHTHGDFSPEWVRCLDLSRCGDDYLAKTVLFPSGIVRDNSLRVVTQAIQRPFLLFDRKPAEKQ